MGVVGLSTIESLVEQLQDVDRAVVRQAVDALVAMAVREPGVLELLEHSLGDAKTRWKWPVAYTLGCAAKASGACMDVLAEGLGSEDQDVRWATQRLMTSLGSQQAAARQVLLKLVCEGSPNQRRMAVYCLRDIGVADQHGAKAILAACGDSEPLVRVAAVTSLVHFKNLAANSTVLLRRLADDDTDERVRNAARFALTRVSGE